ncbi:hypothetical protein [Pseudomonas sp. RGM 3321]|uniref:hypothetical protein n=1 Tax=Pseudomonas sp. RGM 3321 TaxID=2930089 RepID=UPI001FCBE317|nr:hypothetical protein [Pseudomonas sp. RGM 3321]MCJ2375143.1 hypothetical protein [Pseudomonas sp. RGM 3321]
MSNLERYQDSYQGMRSVREIAGGYDAYGNLIEPKADFFHNYDEKVDYSAKIEAEKAYKKDFAHRIKIAIGQMEMICPPKGASA